MEPGALVHGLVELRVTVLHTNGFHEFLDDVIGRHRLQHHHRLDLVEFRGVLRPRHGGRVRAQAHRQQGLLHALGVRPSLGITERSDDVAVLQQADADDATVALPAHPVVADVVGQDVVARVVQRLVLGQEADLEPAEAAELRQVSRIAVAVSGQEVVVDDQFVRVGRDEPALQRHPVHRRERHVLVGQAHLVGPTQQGRPTARGGPGDPHLHESVERFLRRAVVCHCHILPGRNRYAFDATTPQRG